MASAKIYLYDKEDDKTWTKRLSVYVEKNIIAKNRRMLDKMVLKRSEIGKLMDLI